MEERSTIIKFKNITKVFNSVKILNNLSLEVYKNEIVALIGESGCGKSTMLKILIGFYPPDLGEIFYNNSNITHNFYKIRRVAGYVSQENSFYEKLTIEENLRFFAKLYNVKKQEINHRINVLLDLTNLSIHKKILADKISGGMKRRLEFAIALVHNPQLLILDEPFAGLDIKIRDELWHVIKKIKRSGVTVIITTHLLNCSQKNCDRIVILSKGKIIDNFILTNEMRNLKNFSLEEKFLEVSK